MDLSVIGYFSKTHGVKGQLIIKSDKVLFSCYIGSSISVFNF